MFPFYVLLASLVHADNWNTYLYPSDTIQLVWIDLEAIRKSGLFDEDIKVGTEQMLRSSESFRRLVNEVGFDLNRDLHRMTICSNGEQGRQPSSLIILNGNFPQAPLEKAMTDLAERGELSILKIQDLTVYFTHRGQQPFFFALVTDQILLMSPTKAKIEDAIKGLAEVREPKPELVQRGEWDALEPAAVRIHGAFPDRAKEQMARVPQLSSFARQLQGYNLNVRFGEKSTVTGRIELDSEKAAATAETTLKFLVDLGKTFLANSPRADLREALSNLELRASESSVRFNVGLSRELMQTMIDNNRTQRNEFRRRQEQQARPAQPASAP